MNEKLSHIHIEKTPCKGMEFFYVDQCERVVPWAARKGGYKQVRDQTSDVSHLTLDICHLSPYP